MSIGKGKLQRQRERIIELLQADPSRSARSIAAEIGCGVNTVIRTRERHVPRDAENGTPNGKATAHPGAGNLVQPHVGNDFATTHGMYSEARRRPLEDEHRERLRRAHPTEPDDLVNVRARRSALIDLLSAYVSEHGPIRGKGDVVPAARELRLLLDAEERAATAMQERGRERASTGGQTLQDIEAELIAEANRDGGGDDG